MSRQFRVISLLLFAMTLILLVAVVIVAISDGENSISGSNKTAVFDTGDTFDDYARSTVIQEINLTATTSAIAITQIP